MAGGWTADGARPFPDALPGVRSCITCQQALDEQQGFSTYNRRGSKDSQLR